MVAQSDLPRVSRLSSEYEQNARAIDLMVDKVQILSMTIAPEREEGQPLRERWIVDTSYMPASENMIAQIRTLLQQRQEVIRQELHTLGVTLDGSSTRAAPASAASEPTGKKKK